MPLRRNYRFGKSNFLCSFRILKHFIADRTRPVFDIPLRRAGSFHRFRLGQCMRFKRERNALCIRVLLTAETCLCGIGSIPRNSTGRFLRFGCNIDCRRLLIRAVFAREREDCRIFFRPFPFRPIAVRYFLDGEIGQLFRAGFIGKGFATIQTYPMCFCPRCRTSCRDLFLIHNAVRRRIYGDLFL